MAEQNIANSHASDNDSVVAFSFNNQDIRTLNIGDELWFVAKDVCDVLELDVSNSTRYLDDDEHTLSTKQDISNSRNGLVKLINESGLYSLILRSRKPEAKKFKKWVTSEVLPSIRKNGAYLTPEKVEEVLLNPDTLIKLATNLKEEQAKRAEAEKQIALDRPKVVFAETIEVAESTILVGELSKLIKQSTQYDVGQTRLFAWLRDNGYLHKTGSSYNLPTQKSMNLGVFVIKEGTRVGTSGTHITKTTKVTGKGQIYFVKKFHDKMKARRIAAASFSNSGDFQEACNA
ncbi:phage antirepressor KilAC domain-containing protein [Maridesulfovibrio ferrireducens]|uniref:phage antirepressor KilAC domain-containing protein n=1 Tax=Maridesulfovibrio ferrireducens TaxID=246191 RepID=UPI001A2659FC|nr:phage antirepressor KilAC domain-containing protein [Maridesulfovibrio ferrireducens]MBI9112945.1 phage antirepressor KilAC domain-containing protein [Maridesulfovibrio ferrireducens]